MTYLLVTVGIVALVVPGLAARRTRDLPPAHRAEAILTCLVCGVAAIALAVVMAAAPLVLHAGGAHTMARACARAFATNAPLSVVAVVALLVVGTRAIAGWRAACRVDRAAAVEPLLGVHLPAAGFEVVILPTSELVAYSVDGAPAQVVISRGLIEALPDPELTRVLHHEHSHVRNRHHRFLRVAGIVEHAFGIIPGVRASTAALRVALERWADEDAAGPVSTSRDCLRRALLATAGIAPRSLAGAGLHHVDALAERLTALAAPPPAGGRLRAATLGALVAVLGSAALLAIAQCLVAAPTVSAAAGCCLS